MAKLEIHSVSISWGISRGRDTYGYNICRAVSRQTGKTYRTTGGGYDMVGTVIGGWFAAEYQAELQALYARDHLKFKAYSNSGYHVHCELHGLFARPDGPFYMDGGTGIDCMLRIIKECGFEHQRQYNPRTRNKATTGYLISKVTGE